MAKIELNSEVLLHEVEALVYRFKINYIDALLLFCEKNGYDVETVAKIVPSSLKSKIEGSAKELRLLKTQYNNAQTLPI